MQNLPIEPESTRGGLDRYLGPPAVSTVRNTMPAEGDIDESSNEVDCNATPDSPLCELAKAEREKQQGG